MRTIAHKDNRRCLTKWSYTSITATIVLMFPSLFMACCSDEHLDLCYANSVFVHNGDVFVTGEMSIKTPGKPFDEALLWKNNKIIYLCGLLKENVETCAYSVFVTDTNVYMAGFIIDSAQYLKQAALWENEGIQHLTDGSQHASASSVFVSDGDVYAAGYEGNTAVLWKNGVSQHLTDGSQHASANSIFVSDGDVYAAGYEGNTTVLWKNGAMQNLLGAEDSWAESVFVYEGNVYVCGTVKLYPNYAPLIWKNGAVQSLAGGNGWANSVFVYNKDVYVVGNMYAGDPVFWKNGTMQKLPRK